MAKIQTKVIVVKFNKIVKDNDTSTLVIGEEIAKTLEEVAQEMCGSEIVVESEVVNE
jgi:hypothetical protein